MMTKKDMVLKITQLYGRGSSMAIWFAEIAKNKSYEQTKMFFDKMVEQHNRH